jgi:hypothetical protein
VAILGLEFAGFDAWARRIGLGRGWAVFGTIVAVALGALVSIAVIYVYMVSCNCFE